MSNPMKTHGAPSWIAHSGKDPAAARKFYEKVLGWNVVDMPMKDGSAYPGIMLEGGPVGGFSPQPAEEGGWLVYITVDNTDERYSTALKAGAKAVAAPPLCTITPPSAGGNVGMQETAATSVTSTTPSIGSAYAAPAMSSAIDLKSG